MVMALSTQTKRKRTLKWTQQTEKKRIHTAASLLHLPLLLKADYRKTGVYINGTWHSNSSLCLNVFFFHLYLCVTCDVRLTICLVCIKPCSLVGMYRLFREVCYFCYKPRNEFDDCPTRCDLLSLLHLCRQLYMFRVLTPNIRISYSCNYSFWYWLTAMSKIRCY